MSSKSSKTLMKRAGKKIDKQKQDQRAAEAAAKNRHATMTDLKKVNDELRTTNMRLAEQGQALALVKYVLCTKLGVTDEELADNLRAMKRSDALHRLNQLKGMGVNSDIMKQQCQQMGFNASDFPIIFGDTKKEVATDE